MLIGPFLEQPCRCSQEAALEGGIGAASVKAAVLEGQQKHLIHRMQEEGNGWLRRVAEETRQERKNIRMSQLGKIIEEHSDDRRRNGKV